MEKEYLLGYDIGTSSVKASLVDASTGITVASAQYPDTEAPIISHVSTQRRESNRNIIPDARPGMCRQGL